MKFILLEKGNSIISPENKLCSYLKHVEGFPMSTELVQIQEMMVVGSSSVLTLAGHLILLTEGLSLLKRWEKHPHCLLTGPSDLEQFI